MSYINQHEVNRQSVVWGPQDVVVKLLRYWAVQRRRREIESLADKPDWLLQDMGITRDDVREALLNTGDASTHLQNIAQRRRRCS